MRDIRKKYVDLWYEDDRHPRYRGRRTLRHFERDIRRLEA